MAKYYFKARNAKNELIEGARTASSEKEALSSLAAEGLVVFSIEEAGEKFAKAEKKPAASTGGGKGGINFTDVAIFCRQFATLVNAGVTIVDGIEDAGEMSLNPKLRAVIKKIATDIRGGSTLADAMKKYQGVFGAVFVALVAAGEKSGKLGTILKDLAGYLESSVKLTRKVQSASAYPAFIGGFFVLALGGIVLFLIPRFKDMFSGLGADLPLPTQIVITISDIAINYFPLVAAGCIVGFITFKMFHKTRAGRYSVDSTILRLPVFGIIMQKVIFARFFHTLSTLIKSGNDVVISLEIAAKVADNLYIEDKIITVKNRVIEGATISDEMEKLKIFPRMVCRMTAVGEKSGQLEEMFEKLSDYYTDEVDAAVAAMASIIEPLLIIMIGGMVGVVIIAMYMPIFKIGAAMGN